MSWDNKFNEKITVPEKYRALLECKKKQTPIELTRLFHTYFTENELYNKKNKNNIDTNVTLRRLFGMKQTETLSLYNLNSWIRNGLTNDDESDDEIDFSSIMDL